MRPLVLLSLATLLVLVGCHRAASPAAACLPYGPDTVTVAGTLQRLTFPGPPNYEDIGTGDDPETGFFLEPVSPICMLGGREADLGEPVTNVRQIQLVLDSAGYAALGPHVGQPIRLRGTLFPAQTGHHHAPVLLDVVPPLPSSGAP